MTPRQQNLRIIGGLLFVYGVITGWVWRDRAKQPIPLYLERTDQSVRGTSEP